MLSRCKSYLLYYSSMEWNGMTDVLSTYCWSGFTYKWVSLTTTYGLFRKGKIDIENVVGKWHASEYLSYKFADWENCKFVQCGFQRQPWCHSFLLGFLLPEFSIRIAHPTDFMLVLGTRRFCGFFWDEGDLESMNSVPRSTQVSCMTSNKPLCFLPQRLHLYGRIKVLTFF